MVRVFQSEAVSYREIRRRLMGVCGLNVVNKKEASLWCNKCENSRTALKDNPEKYNGRQGPHTLEKILQLSKTVNTHFTSHR